MPTQDELDRFFRENVEEQNKRPEVQALIAEIKKHEKQPAAEEIPEWYTVIKKCLREFECFDMKMFADSGGHEAYAMLDMKLQQHQTLEKLAAIRQVTIMQNNTRDDEYIPSLGYVPKVNILARCKRHSKRAIM